jgi:CRISPR system Cascade subunit CasC
MEEKMNEKRFYLDIHAIQTVPPSNINRDDTGSPKTAIYGGVRRARVSSQSWKRAMRKYFAAESEADLGIRSLNVIKYVADKIIDLDSSVTEESALELAEKMFNDAGIKTKAHKTKALFFLGKKQAEQIAEAALKETIDKKGIKQIFSDNPAVDIALFGRMVADDPSLNEDASAQVAHAISTHEVQTEFDFFTAVDDLASENNAGAAMLDTIEYNSSTLYRYANIAVHELAKQLDNKKQAIDAAKLFIKAFANSMPTGKSNTFANETLPQLLMINIRQDRPVNLVSAYESPVKSRNGNVVPSIERLFDEVKKTEKFVQPPLKTLYVVDQDIKKPEWAEEKDSITALLDDFAATAEEML